MADDKPAETAPQVPAATPAAAMTATPASAPVAASSPAASAEPAAGTPLSEPSLLQQVDKELAEKNKPPEPAKAAEPAKEPEKPADKDAKPADAKPADKAPEAKPAEKDAKATEAKPEEAKPAESAKLEPVEYKYTVPEILKLDDATKAELHTAMDKFRENPAEGFQGLLDLHTKTLGEYATHLQSEQRRVFNEMRAENRKSIMADPVLGGSGFQTTAGAVARMRDLLVPKEMLEPRKFDDGSPRLSIADEFLENTGAGDHPVLWHMLHNAARYLDEPSPPPPNARPTANNGKRGPARLRDVYTHPRSGNGQT